MADGFASGGGEGVRQQSAEDTLQDQLRCADVELTEAKAGLEAARAASSRAVGQPDGVFPAGRDFYRPRRRRGRDPHGAEPAEPRSHVVLHSLGTGRRVR